MQPLSMSAVQARLKEQETIGHLASIYFLLIAQQEEYRAHLQSARTLRTLLVSLHDRIRLAGPALRSDATTTTITAAEVADDMQRMTDATQSRGTVAVDLSRTSTDSLCTTAMAIADALYGDVRHPLPSQVLPVPLSASTPWRRSEMTGQRDMTSPATSETATEQTVQPVSTTASALCVLLYAPTFSAVIPDFVAKLALEEAIEMRPLTNDEGAAHPAFLSRLEAHYAALKAFTSFAATDHTPARTPRETFWRAVEDYARQHEIHHTTLAEVKTHIQQHAVAIAAALLSLVLPVLTALKSLVWVLTPLWPSSTRPQSVLSDASGTTTGYTSFSTYAEDCSYVAWTRGSASPSRPTRTFLGATTDTASSPRGTHARPSWKSTGDSPVHRRRRAESGDGACLDETGSPPPHTAAQRGDLGDWYSGVFWCRALAQLLLGSVLEGVRVCAAFDTAFQQYGRPPAEATASFQTRSAPLSPHQHHHHHDDSRSPVDQLSEPSDIVATPFSCLHAAAQQRECEFTGERLLELMDSLFPSRSRHALCTGADQADDDAGPAVLAFCLSTVDDGVPTVFSLDGLIGEREGSESPLIGDALADSHLLSAAAVTRVAVPPVWSDAELHAALEQLARYVAS